MDHRTSRTHDYGTSRLQDQWTTGLVEHMTGGGLTWVGGLTWLRGSADPAVCIMFSCELTIDTRLRSRLAGSRLSPFKYSTSSLTAANSKFRCGKFKNSWRKFSATTGGAVLDYCATQEVARCHRAAHAGCLHFPPHPGCLKTKLICCRTV